MEPDTYKSQLIPRQNCLSVIALFYFRQGNLRPNLDDPAMAVLRSYPKAGKTNSQARPFKELVSRPGQRSECTVILMRNNAAMFVIYLNSVSFPKGSSQDDFIAGRLAGYSCIPLQSLQLVRNIHRRTIQAAFLLRV
jgi:hypothetical protein